MTILTLGLFAFVPAQGGQGGIWDRLEFYANGRMTAEATVDNVDGVGNDIDNRYRGRTRFRFGGSYELAEDVNLAARVSTASDGNDANNPYWDFGDGDGFNSSSAVVDRFYLDWTASDEIHVLAGKQPHAFVSPPIYGEFIWDQDVSPSGIAAKWTPKTDGPNFDARVAAYIAAEISDDDDAKMLGAQGNVYLPIDDKKVQVSTSFYDWKKPGNAAGNQGNTSLAQDFFIWESFVSGTMPGGPLDEMTGYVEIISNLDESDEDLGWVLGFQLGSSKWVRNNYNVFALLYNLDADALFSPVSQDDTGVPGTGLGNGNGEGMDGFVLGGQYFWRDNIALKLWVLTSDPGGADDEPIRLRLDLDFNVK